MMSEPTAKLGVLACQIEVPITHSTDARDAHLNRIAGLVNAKLQQQRAELVVLPELSSINYSQSSFKNLHRIAEPLHGPSYEVWRQLAQQHQVTVAYSFARRSSTGYRICLAFCTPDGEIAGYYDKIYLAQFGASAEKHYFEAGSEVTCIEINGWRVAPIICADIRTPELCRTLAIDLKADIILHSGAYYRDPSFYSWHPFVITRALENQLFFVSLNRAGRDFGHSLFVPPWVDENQQPLEFAEHKEDLRHLLLERRLIDEARTNYPFLADRREHYPTPGDQKKNGAKGNTAGFGERRELKKHESFFLPSHCCVFELYTIP